MQVSIVGLDISKQVFQLHGVSADGKVAVRKRLRRAQVAPFMAQLSPCVIGIEAGAGAHYWAVAAVWPRGQTHEPAICETLRQGEQERL